MNRLRSLAIGLSKFFPLHLIVSQFKFNIIVVFYWLFLFAVINGYFGVNFGLQSLFLSPEYLNETSYLSFFILGFSVGGFIMAFNTYSYIRLGSKYPFIATIARPFFKFSINNSLLPTLFIINLIVNILNFQRSQEFADSYQLWGFALSTLFGIFTFIVIAFLYFFPTNKDLYKLTGKKEEYFREKASNIKSAIHKKQKWYNEYLSEQEQEYYYIGKNFRLKKSRNCMHYDLNVLRSVFAQNHTNASLFEIVLLISFFSLGFLKDLDVFQIPAGASIMLLITIILMIVSAFFSWLKRWTYPFLIFLLFSINYLSKNTAFFRFESNAFGLSYEKEDMIDYNVNSIREIGFDAESVSKDRSEYIKILENWKDKFDERKPKLVILNTSGGGLRSALWTFSMLQLLDEETNFKFSEYTNMITGASGGMLGAAYYRDLILQDKIRDTNLRDLPVYKDRIGKDLLNRISFSISTSDIFFRFQKAELNGKKYPKDRGWAFEQELISNLNGHLDNDLKFYREPETNADIPTMIFAPTIINDGRRLVMSSQHLAFLNSATLSARNTGLAPEMENIEFLKYFQKNDPLSIRFTSVIRMNATFPYIMPMVTMPTKPGMQIMDAGIRDNYGTKITSQFITGLNDWIKENTSGVVVVRLRDTKKVLEDEVYNDLSMLNKLLLPFGNIYGNFPRVQDFDQDELFINLLKKREFPIDVVTFNLREKKEDVIALSWHLTQQEKAKIYKATQSEGNKESLKSLKTLLGIKNERGKE